MNPLDSLSFEPKTKQKLDEMIQKIPLFHRRLAQTVVLQRSAELARQRGETMIHEEDVVRAFLTEVPPAFYSLMIRLMDEVGFDYQRIEQEWEDEQKRSS